MSKELIQYPSDFIDPFEKNKKDYCLKYAKAFDENAGKGVESALFRNNTEAYEKRRLLANGKQDPDQYLTRVGVKGGRNGKSWKSLDTSILPIAPKFVELLVGKVISKGYDAKGFRRTVVKGIDRASVEEEKKFKASLAEQVINKDFVQGLNQKGINMPLNEDGTPVPDNINEVDTYAEIFRKDEYAMEAKDALLVWFDSNNMEQLLYEAVEDMVKIGDGGLCTDMSNDGNVKIRRLIPENVIANKCRYDDFRDLYRIGEYIQVTISELRKMWPGQSEKTFQKIAEQKRGRQFNVNYWDPNYDISLGYPYDNDKTTILDARWISTDVWKHTETKDKFGSKKVSRKPYNFPTDYKGNKISPEDYKKKHPNKNIIETEIENVYKCKYIVGTDYCFDFGLANNIQRTANSLYGANLGYFLYHMTNSIMEKIEPIINMIQVAWLQHQNHIARSKPSGLSIEMSAIEGLSAGKNKDKLTMKEAIRLYFDTGVVFWRRKNYSNASNQFQPIQELQNNISNDAEKFLSFIFQYIELLRNILGVNEVEDASTPNPEILKGVAEMAAMGTKNALKDLYQGTKSIYERTAKSVIDLTPDSREISKNKGFENALGARSQEFWKTLGLREMGIIVEEGPDVAQRQVLENAITQSAAKELITPDEAADFLMDDNLVRAAQQLKDKIKKRQKENEEQQMRLSEKQKNDNIEAAQAASQAEIQRLEREAQINKDYETHKTNEMIRLKQLEHELKMKEIAMEKGFDQEMQDDQQDHEIRKTVLEGEVDIKVDKAKPKPVVAASSGPKK